MIDQEQKMDINGLIMLVLNNKTNLKEMLEYAYVLFTALGKSRELDYVAEQLKNLSLMRDVMIVQTVTEDQETKLNYYDKDLGDEYDYNEGLEEKMANIKLQILSYVAEIIRQLNEEPKIEL